MLFMSEERLSNSPFVEKIWRTQTVQTGTFLSVAVTHWEMVVSNFEGKLAVTVRGPETVPTEAQVTETGAECLGIVFKLGTVLQPLPVEKLVNDWINLPEANSRAVWLHGSTWQVPTYENADTFVERMVREGLLARESIVEEMLQGHIKDVSLRSVQRRFLRSTGLTQGEIYQIERARQAHALLLGGTPILDVVEQLGYSDQPHITRLLKRYLGQTPAQIIRSPMPTSMDSYS
jgi:AraC-like DNA-binding protein